MHTYLRAVGFSKYKNRRQLEQLYYNIMRSANRKMITTISVDTSLIQFEKDFGLDFGLSLIGEYDIDGNVSIEHCFPYCKGDTFLTYENISIEKQTDKESYAGVVEDCRLGMTIIFYLNNIADYAKSKWFNYSNRHLHQVKFSALSISGTILLGMYKDSKQKKYEANQNKRHDKLLYEASSGDAEAIDNLASEEMDIFNSLIARVQSEDVLSIVDTSFMPCGVECDHYMLIGNIIKLQEVINTYTDEKIYRMLLDVNEIYITVYINQLDLQGEPKIGRRFRGEVWLQGIVKI